MIILLLAIPRDVTDFRDITDERFVLRSYGPGELKYISWVFDFDNQIFYEV